MTLEQFIDGLVWLIPIIISVVLIYVFGSQIWKSKSTIQEAENEALDRMSELPMTQRPYHQKHEPTIPLDEAVRKAENPVVERPFQHPPPQPNLPGKATHWINTGTGTGTKISACGLVGPDHHTRDPRKTDCNNCRRTWEWKNRISQIGNQK